MTIGTLSSDPVMCKFMDDTLGEYADRKYLDVDYMSFTSRKEYLDAHRSFDLLFIDEGVDHRSSLETARRIRMEDSQVALALLAPTSEKVFEAFMVQAHRYIVKPVSQTSVFEAIDGCRKTMFSNQIVLVRLSGSYIALQSEDIFAIEADGKESRVRTRTQTYQTTSSYSQIKAQLPDEYFFLVHRSFAVNMNHIRSFDAEHVELINGTNIPLSRRRKVEFYRAYTQFIKRHSGI